MDPLAVWVGTSGAGPANVMVTRGGRVKVLDFGLAKMTAPEQAASVDSEMPTDVQTREGVVII